MCLIIIAYTGFVKMLRETEYTPAAKPSSLCAQINRLL